MIRVSCHFATFPIHFCISTEISQIVHSRKAFRITNRSSAKEIPLYATLRVLEINNNALISLSDLLGVRTSKLLPLIVFQMTKNRAPGYISCRSPIVLHH